MPGRPKALPVVKGRKHRLLQAAEAVGAKREGAIGVKDFEDIPPAILDPDVEKYVDIVEHGLTRNDLPRKKVAIIGAGLAGLSAARELIKAHHDVTIFEATQRVGGRVHTVRDSFFENHAEAGAMRIPESHKVVNKYLEVFKLKTEPFNGYNEAGYYYLFGETFLIKEYNDKPWILHRFLKQKHDYEFNDELLVEGPGKKSIVDFWEDTFQRLLKEVNYPVEKHDHDAALKAWEELCEKYDVSFGDYLTKYASPKWKDGSMELFGLIGSGIGGYQSTFTSSFLENIREEISLRAEVSKPDVNFNEIDGGNDKLPQAFVPYVRDKLVLGATVTNIDLVSKKYKITYKKGISKFTTEADFDHVVLAVPITTLRAIQVTPSFSTGKLRAIRELHYQHASKVMLEFSSRFWNDPNSPINFRDPKDPTKKVGGALTTDLPIRNVYFPDHGQDSGRGVVLVSYTWEDDAIYWASKTKDQQVREALEQFAALMKVLPPKHGQAPFDVLPLFETGDIKNWTTDPLTIGAYAFFDPGQMDAFFADVVSAEGNIHFAGEHASFDHAWIEGAVQSGLRVAMEIHGEPATTHHG